MSIHIHRMEEKNECNPLEILEKKILECCDNHCITFEVGNYSFTTWSSGHVDMRQKTDGFGFFYRQLFSDASIKEIEFLTENVDEILCAARIASEEVRKKECEKKCREKMALDKLRKKVC